MTPTDPIAAAEATVAAARQQAEAKAASVLDAAYAAAWAEMQGLVEAGEMDPAQLTDINVAAWAALGE